MRQRHLARRLRVLSVSLLETLEKRSMLHAGHVHGVAEAEILNPGVYTGEHIPASTVLKAFPQLAGKNLWDPSTFNPRNSTNQADWLYDPHFVEDDLLANKSDLYPANSLAGGPEAGPSLPDLVPLTGSGYLSPSIDKTEIPGHNLMRFTTAVGNQGAGPATLTSANTGTPPSGSGITSWINPDGSQNVLQQIYTYDGTRFNFTSYRPAGRMVWHSGHSHFHLEGYASYRLLTNVAGSPGPVATRSGFDGSAAVGDKVGFCLVNINSSFIMPGTSTSTTTLPGYNALGQPTTSCGFLQGISVGNADVYSSIYDGQWIDVTGVPNGSYFLEVTLDALNVIQESNESNNTVIVPVTLNTSSASGGTVVADRFEPNNSFTAATDLGELGVQNQPGLTAHISGESDFFKFTAASSGSYNVQLLIADRDMNLYLYDNAHTLIASSTISASGTATSPLTETVTTSFIAGQTYYVEARAFGSDITPTTSAISSNYALKVNINPTLVNAVTDGSASEVGLTDGMVSFTRNGPTSSPLLVNFSVSGTATRGVDYNLFQDGVPISGNSLSIGNEASVANLQVVPIGDSLVEANETVIITLTSGAYVLNGASATVVINDVPPAAIASNFGYETAQTVSFDFSLNVGASLAASDLVLLNTTTNQVVAAATAQYDTPNNRATFGFAGILPDGNYTATIAQSSLTHAQGVALAADATLSFFVLAGDFNRDHTVNFDDLLMLAQNYGTTGKTFSQGNINYDAGGNVDFDDLLALAQQYGTTLSIAASSRTLTSASARTSMRRRSADVLD